MEFLVTRTYDTIFADDETNISNGEPSETGEMFRDEPMGLRSVVEGLRSDSEVSSAPIRRPQDAAGTWTMQRETCHRTGDETTYHRHIRHIDGRPLSGSQLFRLYRAANLVTH